LKVFDFIGGPCWDRTNDLLIKRLEVVF